MADFSTAESRRPANILLTAIGRAAQCRRCGAVQAIRDAVVGQQARCGPAPNQRGFSATSCDAVLEFVDYRVVSDPRVLQDYLDAAQDARSVSYDFETTGLNPFQHRLVGMSFCREDQPGVAVYVPIWHQRGALMREPVLREIVAPFLENVPMNAHNFDFEFRWTWLKFGVEPMIHSDTKIEAWLDDVNRMSRFNRATRSLRLKDVSREILKLDVTDIDELVDLKQHDFSHLSVDEAFEYGCQDSDLTTRLVRRLRDNNVGMQPLVHRIEHDLIDVTARMELRGIKLDASALRAGMPALAREIDRLRDEVYQLMGFDAPEAESDDDELVEAAGDPFASFRARALPPLDLDSPSKVAKVLFKGRSEGGLDIPFDRNFIGKPNKDFPDGMPSTSKKALELVREDHEVVDMYLRYREVIYARTNFIEKLPDRIEAVSGALHGSFNQTGTPTARYASSGPNMQNISKKRE